ncbi:hypothetical protein [Luteipulveratus mongoliensis]|uniref:Uncharacterized protein n=1 Tax=Luteipulveratus mongoliensis TaxID=571913 RepID=A0A0K1JE56_9MICO|nr:hypothetical protein [Luteipulveratus mongoliensis]AKU14870.1 hypothetical protein VV02_01640 [Luteipulveratus mongoliensis]
MFGRKQKATTRRDSGSAEPSYALAKSPQGEVLGLWTREEELARNTGLVDAILAQHDLWAEVEMGRKIVPNTMNDRGGFLVLFDAETPRSAGEMAITLHVDGQEYPIHDTFETFAQDAATNKLSILRTTFADLSNDDQSRLFRVLAEAYGDNAPQTRAITRTALQCLGCWRGYQASTLLFIRDTRAQGIPMAGVNSRVEDMQACLDCGGTAAVWIYDPEHVPD